MNTEQLMQYFDIAALVAIALGALGGFSKGLFKSTYNFITSFVIIIIGWFALDSVIASILNYDISSVYALEFEGIKVTTISDFVASILPTYININDPNIVIQETQIYSLAISLVSMALKLVFLIVLLILNATIFKFIFWIIWLIIKPKKVKNDKGRYVRPKKTFVGRICGAGIGALSAVLFLLVVAVPLSGLASIGSTLVDVAGALPDDTTVELDENMRFNVYLSKNSNEIYVLSEREANPVLDQLGPTEKSMLEFLGKYDELIMGKIFANVKFSDVPVDQYLFDEIFSFKYSQQVASDSNGDNKQVIQVKLRKELMVLADALKAVSTEVDITKGFSTDTLMSLSQETINTVFEKVGSLELINVLVPVGIDYYTMTMTEESELPVTNEELKTILVKVSQCKMGDEFKKIGGAVGEIISAIKEVDKSTLPTDENGNYDTISLIMSLDKEKVNNALKDIADITFIDDISDLALNSLVSSGILDQYLQLEPTITVSEDGYYELNGIKTSVLKVEGTDPILTKSDDNFWVINDTKTTVSISDSTLVLNIEDVKLSEELLAIGDIYGACQQLGITSFNDLKAIVDSENFTDENVQLLSNAIFGLKIISSNSENFAVLVNNIIPPDYKNLITLEDIQKEDLYSILCVAKVLISSGLLEEDSEVDYVALLTENGEQLVDYIYSSPAVTKNVNSIISGILKMAGLNEYITIPENFDFSSEDGKGKQELKSLISAAGHILDLGVLEENFDFTTIEDETIDSLAVCLSKSEIITSNMNNLISKLTESAGDSLPIASIDKEDWTEEEFKSALKSAKLLLGYSDDYIAGVLGLQDEEINMILSSKLITKTVVNLLVDLTSEGEDLHDVLIVNYDKDSNEWFDVYEDGSLKTKGELRILLTSIKLILDENDDLNNLDTNQILNKVINLKDGSVVDGVEQPDEIGQILSSKIIKDTIINQLYKFAYNEDPNIEGLLIIPATLEKTSKAWDDSFDESNVRTDGELRKLFKAVSTIFSEDDSLDLNQFDVNTIMNLNDSEIDNIVASIVIESTIKNELYKLGRAENAVIVVDELKLNVPETFKKEIKALIKAAKLVLADPETGEVDINEPNVDINRILKLDDDEQTILLASIIVTDTVIDKIYDYKYDELTNSDALLVIPEELTKDSIEWLDSYDVDNNRIDGELRKLFTSINALFGNKDIDLDNFDTNIILDLNETRINTMMSSKIVEETVRRQVYKLDEGEDSVLVINETILEGEGVLASELNALIAAVDIVLVPGSNGKPDLNNPEVDMNSLLSLNEEEKTTLLSSIIISETMVKEIKNISALKTDSIRDEDWYTDNGELRKFIDAASIVLGDDIESFDINNILGLKNDLGSDDDQIGILLKSQTMSQTIAYNIINLNNEAIVVNESDYHSSSWLDDTSSNNPAEWEKGEIRNLLGSFKTLLGDSNFTDATFDFDTVLDLSKEQITSIFDSIIISDSVAIQVKVLIYGALKDYIEVSGTTEDEKLITIKEDQVNLIFAIKDMNDLGINYTNLEYSSFSNALTPDYGQDENEKPDQLAWALTQSTIITNSLGKMFNKILGSALDESTMDLVNLDLTIDEWKGDRNDTNPGELAKLLRTITVLQDLDEATSISNATTADAISKPLLKINDSKVLQRLIPTYMDKALDNVDDWKVDPSPELTKDEWDQEIVVLAELIEKVNDAGGSLNGLSVTGTGAMSTTHLGGILKQVARSLILEINNIKQPLIVGVNSVFGENTASIDSIGDVTYDIVDDKVTTYNNKVAAWDKEIAALMYSINKLNAIDDPNIFDDTTVSAPDYTQGVKNARLVGEFLDSLSDSKLMAPITNAIFEKTLENMEVTNSYITSLVNSVIDGEGTYSFKLRYIAMACTAPSHIGEVEEE